MESQRPKYYEDVKKCVDDVIGKVGKKIVMGMPLALGKPNLLANEFYRRAKEDPSIDLTILSALFLEKPTWSSDLERRLVAPIAERTWPTWPDFDCIRDLRANKLPPNVKIHEFFSRAATYLSVEYAQRNHISTNYTHVVRDIIKIGMNVAAQMLAKKTIDGKVYYSASCNSDTPLEAARALREEEKKGRKVAIIGMVNENLPFMYGDACSDGSEADMIVDNPDYYFDLFNVPKEPVTVQDHMIGLYTSTLVKDGGTLQIGIGSLGDGLVCGLQARQDHNDQYKKLISDMKVQDNWPNMIEEIGGLETFDQGLYGSSEMLVDGFIHLYKSGILKRKVYENAAIQKLLNEGKITEKITPEFLDLMVEEDAVRTRLSEKDVLLLQELGIFKDSLTYEDECIVNGDKRIPANLSDETARKAIIETCMGTALKGGVIMHGAFFVGPERFYQSLRDMSEEERMQFSMTGVEVVNQLYGGETLRRLQRIHGRFVNAGLVASLNGAVASDALEDGRVISGIGGQYNFVSMAHELKDGRGVIMIRSTRMEGEKAKSNIVFNYGHCSVPKHLRDIIVTEYGIADLRGKSDEDVAISLIHVADSRFQEDLLTQAKKAGKVAKSYQIPERFRNNSPEHLNALAAPYKEKGLFVLFPFGTIFKPEEVMIGQALRAFKANVDNKKGKTLFNLVRRMFGPDSASAKPFLERMQLANPSSIKEKLMKKVVVFALESAGYIK
ncbi:MAG: hypothetical protein KJ737_23820 [Proteobacteria bacterium]|nr:hypothetical protein [Pseudomonadota bacterium]